MSTNTCPLDIPKFQIGNTIRTYGEYRNVADDYALIDPTTPGCDVMDPDGVETEYTMLNGIYRTSTGIYQLSFLLDIVGLWYVRWWSTGNIVTSTELSVRVIPANTY